MNPLLENPLVVRLGWTLLHFAWQGAVVAAVFGVVNALTKSLPPHRRYFIAYFALIASGTCPIVTFAMLRAPALPSPAARIPPAIQAAPSKEFGGAPRHVENLPTSAPNDLQKADELDPATDPANAISAVGITWQPILVATWFFGVLALSLRHAGAWFRLRRTRREARPIEDDVLLQMLSTLKERLRLNRAVELLESARLHAPATIGFLKPAILIPTSALMGLERWQLEAVIAHELAHIRRWDFAANLLQCAIETALFYHPAVWWISRVVRQEREFCADDTALAICGDRKGYALALTRLAELSAPLDLAVAATGGNLLTRIQRIVGRTEPQRSGAISVSVALLVAGALVIALIAPRVVADDAKVVEVKPGESIQAALDAAPEGATVRVAAGEFRERVNVAKRLTLEGAGWDKTRIVMPAEDAAKRKEFEDRIQAVQNPDKREALIEQSRKALDGPVLLVADARDIVIRGIRVASNGKEDSRGTVPLAEIRSAQVRLNHCAFTGPAQNGIQIGNGAEVEMAECLVAGLWGEGIIINGARSADPRVIIRDSEIRNIYHYGIQIGRGCDRVRIQRCRISGTAWHGIRYDSASPFIEGNTIYDHARSGIYASGRTRATVRGNLFLRNEMNGRVVLVRQPGP
jgi:parallel beta-helix repeat protein